VIPILVKGKWCQKWNKGQCLSWVVRGGTGINGVKFINNNYYCSYTIWIYIITQVILAFWLVLAYYLLEDRRTIDVIITKFFPPCLKMAESFENLDNILHDWAKDKVQKSIVNALNRYEKHSLARRRKIKPFRFQKMTQKKYSSSLSRQLSETKPNTKLVLVGWEPLRYLEFNKPNKQNVYEINLFKKFNFSQSQNNCWHTDWCQ